MTMQDMKTLSVMIGQNVDVQRISHSGNSRRVVYTGTVADVSEIRSADELTTVGAVVGFADGKRIQLRKNADRRRLVVVAK